MTKRTGTISPREICPPDHEHDASSRCYKQHRCGCEPCRIRHRVESREYRRERQYRLAVAQQFPDLAYLAPGVVPADVAANHLRQLVHAGLTLGELSRMTGGMIAVGQLSKILTGAQPSVGRELERSILSLNLDDRGHDRTEPDRPVPTTLTQPVEAFRVTRRLRVCLAQGYPMAEIGRMTGYPTSWVKLLAYGGATCPLWVLPSALAVVDRVMDYCLREPNWPLPHHLRGDKSSILSAVRLAAKLGTYLPWQWDDLDARRSKTIGNPIQKVDSYERLRLIPLRATAA